MKREIIPAILEKDIRIFKERLAIIKSLRPKPMMIQIDVVDGKFAPWLSIIDAKKIKPLLRGISFEVDLMTVDSLTHAQRWIKAGAERVIFHIESKAAKDQEEVIAYIKRKKREVGISLNARSDISLLMPYIETVDCVVLLGGDPGRSGQKFQPHVLKKIKILRRKYPTLPIEVDIGVNLTTAAKMLQAGATRLAVASAIHGANDPQKAYKKLLKLTSK